MRIQRIAVGALLGLTTCMVVIPLAHADINQCSAGSVCLWADNNFSGFLGYRTGGGLTDVSVTANDKASSWANRGSWNASWYVDTSGRGKCVNMTPGGSANMSAIDNDKLSSWKVWGYC